MSAKKTAISEHCQEGKSPTLDSFSGESCVSFSEKRRFCEGPACLSPCCTSFRIGGVMSNHQGGMFLFKIHFFPSSECLQDVCERNLSRTSFSKSFSGNTGLLFNHGTLAWQTPSISACHYVWVMNVQFSNIKNLENLIHSLLGKYSLKKD